MKGILFFILLAITLNFSVFAQDSITVNITGTCTTLTGTYQFTGLVNSKNNYSAEFDIEGNLAQLQIGFDGTKWVFYTDNDITDFGFFNTNVPNDVLPPNTGWQVERCEDGTLIINGGVASVTDFSLSNNFNIYQISNEFLEIKFESFINNQNLYLFNIFGKEVFTQRINYNKQKININRLSKGIYFVKVNNFVKKIIIH